jgi:hypothetical protein
MANLDIDASDVEKVNKILGRIRGSRFKRQNPYNLNHPIQTNRFNGLKNIDIQI